MKKYMFDPELRKIHDTVIFTSTKYILPVALAAILIMKNFWLEDGCHRTPNDKKSLDPIEYKK